MTPDRLLPLPDGRRLALDDRGDPAGTPVLYLHGTPDSRLARHPDDDIARRHGVRLLAVDRPGIGESDPDPTATPTSVATDLVAVLDALGVPEVVVLAWSAGSIWALALAGTHPGRVTRLTLAAPLVPADAYDDPRVLEGADDARRLFADARRGAPPDEVGAELAMWLVPPEIDRPTATSMLATSLDAVADVVGAGERLVAALRSSVVGGLTGLERDLAAQATPLGALIDTVAAPASIHVGADDEVTPPAMATWLGERLGTAPTIHAGLGHALPILRWSQLLAEAAGHR